MLRIGKQRDGSKVGVFIYCQQHAREWVTPIACAETAERLLRNYGIDPTSNKLVNNLDIFILPTINPDGAQYSMYDFTSQRKNMTRYCAGGGQPRRERSQHLGCRSQPEPVDWNALRWLLGRVDDVHE